MHWAQLLTNKLGLKLLNVDVQHLKMSDRVLYQGLIVRFATAIVLGEHFLRSVLQFTFYHDCDCHGIE